MTSHIFAFTRQARRRVVVERDRFPEIDGSWMTQWKRPIGLVIWPVVPDFWIWKLQ